MHPLTTPRPFARLPPHFTRHQEQKGTWIYRKDRSAPRPAKKSLEELASCFVGLLEVKQAAGLTVTDQAVVMLQNEYLELHRRDRADERPAKGSLEELS